MFKPETVSIPSVHYNFLAKDKNSDEIVEYRVQDLSEKYYELAVEFMAKYFLPDETLCSSKNVSMIPEPVRIFSDFWRQALTQKLSIGCFRNNDQNDELVGVNILSASSINDPVDEIKVSLCLVHRLYNLV